jgi:hypothetical protein
MSKMGLHDPFGYLKHRLWPKERPKVKLKVWFPTIKSQESSWFLCMQVACNISLENSQWGLQLCLRPHLNRRFAHKVMGSEVCIQSYGAPKSQKSQLWEFRDSHLRVPGQNAIWMWALWRGRRYTLRGEGGGFLQVRAVVNLASPNLPVVRPSTKNVRTMHWPTYCLVCVGSCEWLIACHSS